MSVATDHAGRMSWTLKTLAQLAVAATAAAQFGKLPLISDRQSARAFCSAGGLGRTACRSRTVVVRDAATDSRGPVRIHGVHDGMQLVEDFLSPSEARCVRMTRRVLVFSPAT